MSRNPGPVAAAGCTAAALLALPACSSGGGGGMLLDDTASAAGQGDQPSAMDLTLDQDGNCTGSLTLGDKRSVQLVKRGDEVWMKPDAAFWESQIPGKAGSAAAELFRNRYVHRTTDNPLLKGMGDTVDVSKPSRLQESQLRSPCATR